MRTPSLRPLSTVAATTEEVRGRYPFERALPPDSEAWTSLPPASLVTTAADIVEQRW
jgi:hypothetical protein